jgi:hypothetical protein
MNARVKRFLAWLPIFGLAALAVRLALVWDRLPARMMSHFDAAGNPNGWMNRGGFALTPFILLFPIFALLAVMTDRVSRRKPVAGWVLLALSLALAAVTLTVFWSAIDANLYHTQLEMLPMWIVLFVIVPLSFAIGIDWRWWLSSRRKQALAQHTGVARVIAEESHGSPLMAAVIALAGVGVLVAVILVDRVAPAMILVILFVTLTAVLLSACWAWRGFTYRFTTAAVDVLTLGFRLRRIPLSEIRDFSAERVNPLTDFGGWGIKGYGSDTAYIWGGRTALHIKTSTGDVYLGHKDPDRLVRDLEMVLNPAHR